MAEVKRILITGALGQIGSELTLAFRKQYGNDNVIASDLRNDPPRSITESGPYEVINVLEPASLRAVCDRYQVNAVVHLAAILSATGEGNPGLCWDVNMNGTLNLLELAREREFVRILVPSSIAVFGPETPRNNTPQETVLMPKTMYGVTKVAGELVSDYYFHKYGLDVRGLRYPGIISAETLPGGGTTDYAVEIYYKAVAEGSYTCFVKPETKLPMMYMPDCLKATVDLFQAPLERLVHHSDFNVGSLSFTAAELAASIQKHRPDFTVDYKPDYRQGIADTWPTSVDDSAAREQWGWQPEYDLDTMTADMLKKLQKRHDAGKLYS